jgi:site-specific DNA-methyltransferase (adenine-specific)
MTENIKLYHGDCLEVMKDIPNNSVDMIVTDVPYKVISGGRSKAKNQPSGILSKNDGKIFEHNDIEPSKYMSELYRVLKEGTHCYIFINFINLTNMITEAERVGFKMHTLLVWKKNNKTPSRWYMKNQEYILFMRKGKAKPVRDGGVGHILEFNNIIGNKLHPCEKPVDLLELLIKNSSNENDVVLDCFMGSGSTGVACVNTNRKFIGVELDETYFNIAKERIEDTYNQEQEQ